MEVFLVIPEIRVPISISNLEEILSKILPKKEHIEKLMKISQLRDEKVDREIIRAFYTKDQLGRYRTLDFGEDDSYLGQQDFLIEDLES